ncbi:hypothetical protein IKN40_00125 [bacterium]|nr:hypothetical protein [bacterium]
MSWFYPILELGTAIIF